MTGRANSRVLPAGRPYDVRRILRNFAAAMSGEAVSKGAAFLATIVVARSLSTADFGRFSFALALVSVALLFSDVGLQIAATRAIAADRRRVGEYVAAALSTGVAFAAVAYAVLVVAAATGLLPRLSTPPVAVMALLLPLAAVINALWSGLRGHERQDLVYAAYAGSSLLLLLGVVIVGVTAASLTAIAAIYAAAYAARLLITVALVRRSLGRLRLEYGGQATRALLTAAPAAALAYVFQDVYSHADVVLLGFLVPPVDVGHYAAAYRLVDAGTFLTAGAMTAALFPVFARLSRDAPDAAGLLYERSTRLLAAALVPLAVLVGGLAEPIVSAIYGASKSEAGDLLLLLSLSMLLIPVNFVTTFFALATGRTREAIASTGLAATVNIVANLVAIPLYGVEAAALTTLLAEAVMLLTFSVLLARGGLRTRTLRSVTTAAAVASVPFALFFLEPDSSTTIAVLGIPATVAAARLTGLVHADDVRLLRHAVRRGGAA